MAAVAAAAREEAVPRARAQSAAAEAESGSGPSRRTRTESSGSRAATWAAPPAGASDRRPREPGPPSSPSLHVSRVPRQAVDFARQPLEERGGRRPPPGAPGGGPGRAGFFLRRPWPCPLAPALAPALPALRALCAGPARGRADMGAKQSGPAAANGRTRAYSGSDLPSSSSSSGGANGTAGGGARAAAAGRLPAQVPSAHQPSASGGAAAASAAPRSRSLGGAVGTVASGARAAQSTFSIPNSSSGPYGSQDSVHSSPEDGGSSGGRDRPASGGPGGPRLVIGSLPAHLSPHMFGGTAPSLSGPPRVARGPRLRVFLPFSFSPSAWAPGVRRAAGPGHPSWGWEGEGAGERAS